MKFRFDKEKQKLKLIESSRVEWHQLKLHLTRHAKNYKFHPRVRLGVWDGKISHFHHGEIDMGLWKEAYRLCKINNWKFEIENKEDFPINRDIKKEDVVDFCKEFFKNRKTKDGKNFFPYKHQINAAYKILRNRYCLIEVATGGGKSLIFAIVCFFILSKISKKAKFLLLVPSITLVTQFYDDIKDYNEGFINDNPNPLDLKICEIMSEKPRRDEGECNIFIGTVQSLEKRDKKFFKQFHVVTTDECLDPDTKITMYDGSKKKIKNIQIGELVKTKNEKTGEIEIKEVDYIYENLSINEDMYEIELENSEKIKITANHKVKLKSGVWKRVDELKENDDIIYYEEL